MEENYKLSKSEEERARSLHEKAIVINSLDSTPFKEYDDEYFEGILKTGINVFGNSLYVGASKSLDPIKKFLENTAIWYSILEKSKKAIMARTVKDIEKAKRENKLAIFFSTQNADFINDPSYIKLFRELGFRVFQLTYQRRNLIGDGCGERNPAGLSKFGLEVVEEMNNTGIVIDLSHVSKTTALDAIEISKEPCIYSHSSIYSIVPAIRNRTDEELKAMAEKGGVIGIVPKSNWIKVDGLTAGTTINDYLDHFDYVVNLVGADFVGIGLDIGDGRKPVGKYKDELSPTSAWALKYTELFGPKAVHPMYTPGYPLENVHPKGLSPPYPEVLNITRGLVVRGYSDIEILKILGSNFLRVFKKVWPSAR